MVALPEQELEVLQELIREVLRGSSLCLIVNVF